MQKLEHHFEEKQRVKLQHKGGTHHGRIETINRSGELNVLLDSGHHVLAHPENDQVEPEDFESLAPEHIEMVRRALSNGQLDEMDAYLVRDAFGKIGMMVCLDGTTDAEQTLRRIAKKYANASVGSGTFAKRAGSRFLVGQKIFDRSRKKRATVKAIDSGPLGLKIEYEGGDPGEVDLEYATGCMEIL